MVTNAFWIGMHAAHITHVTEEGQRFMDRMRNGQHLTTVRGDHLQVIAADGQPIGYGIVLERNVETIHFHDEDGRHAELERVEQECLRHGITGTVSATVCPIDETETYSVH